MTPTDNDWNELHLSGNPAVRQLEVLGYTFVPADVLEGERDSLKEVVLTRRLS
jgi:hypothetical protein